MTDKTRGWPPHRRAEQARRLKQRQIWRASTGPKTDEGKKKVSQNRLKHGLRSEEFCELRRLLRMQRDFARACREDMNMH